MDELKCACKSSITAGPIILEVLDVEGLESRGWTCQGYSDKATVMQVSVEPDADAVLRGVRN